MQISKTETLLTISGIRSSRAYQAVMISKAGWILPHIWEGSEGDETSPVLVYQTQGISLREWASREPPAGQMDELIQALLDLSEKLERFLLDEGKLFWDPDWIRFDPENGRFRIVYFPFEDAPVPETGFFVQTARYLWEASVRGMWRDTEVIVKLHRLAKAMFAKEEGNEKWQQLLGEGPAEEAAAIIRQYEMDKHLAEEMPRPGQEERMAALTVIAEPFREDSFWEKWLRFIQFLREKSPIRLR